MESEHDSAGPGPDGVCFVISPFGGWHDRYYLDVFVPAIKAADLDPKRADSLFRPSNIVHDIWHLVTTSRVMLADLTGKNPNVFYELGLAHAAKKPVLLLTQDIEDVPFDLRGLRIIQYDVRHPHWGSELEKKITNALRETLESPEKAVLPTFLREDPERQPPVTPEDILFINIQQQLNALRAQLVRPSPANVPDLPPEPVISDPPTQAADLSISLYLP